MTRYDFAELTNYDFESLCRDLLERHLGVRLELFTPGPDKGIDLRHMAPGASTGLIVQCKRFDAKDWSGLKRNLSKVELPKISKLQPERYLVATSVNMTPHRKDQLMVQLSPWVRGVDDIFGHDDLLGLLSRYPEVERQHIKLWLTSAEVLRAVLNWGTSVRSADIVQRLPRQARVWAPNDSFNRALDLLGKGRLCLIAGPAGIGKTMLADVILAHYAARGYEPVAVSGDIGEADQVWVSGRRQIFMYDDFLGRVSLSELALQKNEDGRLASFFRRVRTDSSKLLVLTTREYILAEARNKYSRLREEEFEQFTYILNLSDYTRRIRAQILYNHLFYSELPDRLKAAFNPERKYLRIIGHQNYSPRLIEQAVTLPGVSEMNPDQFASRLLSTLNDPSSLWRSMFDDLYPNARALLTALAILPSRVFLDDLEKAVCSLTDLNGFDTVALHQALKTVEGTFLTVSLAGGRRNFDRRVVEPRDPSVSDFLRQFVSESRTTAQRLLDTAVFFEQVQALWDVVHDTRFLDEEEVAAAALNLVSSPSPQVHRVQFGDADVHDESASPEYELRVMFLFSLRRGQNLKKQDLRRLFQALEFLTQRWSENSGDKREALALLRFVDNTQMPPNIVEHLRRGVLTLFTDSLVWREDWELLLDLFDHDPALMERTNRTLDEWAEAFLDDMPDQVSNVRLNYDQSHAVEEEVSELAYLAKRFGVSIAEYVAKLDEYANELRSEEPYEDDDYEGDRRVAYEDQDERIIDEMFSSLAVE